MRSSKKVINNRRKNKFSYDVLEDRRVLATLTGVDAQGVVTIDLTDNNNVAVVDVASNGNLTINASQDIDSSTAGTQTLPAANVSQFVVNGDASRATQAVAFGGAFTNAANRGVGSITVTDVNSVTFNGQYDIANNLTVTLVGTDGRVGDGTGGRVSVGGMTDIDARNNAIGLNNSTNDFNTVSLNTAGTRQTAVISDANNIDFSIVRTTGDFIVTAGGDVTDSIGAVMEIGRDGRFDAANVTLGDNPSDVTNFFRSAFDVSGHVQLQEDTNTIFLTSTMGSLDVDSEGGVYDGRTTTVTVNGLADINGANRIRLGENGTDTFNAGTIQLNSLGHIHVTEDSNTDIVGTNTGNSLDIASHGNIGDAAGTSINVVRQTGLEGDNIVLGDSASDVFNSGSLYFFTLGDYFVTEDSSSHIIETKNRARRFDLTSAGAITDSADARVFVELLAEFDAESVNIGDTQTDAFNAGSVHFRTDGRFKISENSALNISDVNMDGVQSVNTADNSVINANGDITDSANALTNVTRSAAFFGHNVFLGDTIDDAFNAGSITFATNVSETGIVNITEDSPTVIGGNNNANVLRLNSGGAITDGPNSDVDVAGNARLTTANNGGIVLGDSGVDGNGNAFDATFDVGTLTLVTNGNGNVMIEEDSTITLAGVSRANSMTLIADGGSGDILDAADARITVQRNLNVTGDLINLGTGVDANGVASDFLSLASLTFNSTGNTNIAGDNGYFLTGNSLAGNTLILRSAGNIISTAGSETRAQSSAFFEAVDILIGNLADDCFDVLDTDANGNKSLTVNNSGPSANTDVVLGC